MIRPLRRLTAALIAAVVLTLGLPSTSAAQVDRIDLKSHYPNLELVRAGHYLEGNNYISGEARRSVLWFEELSRNRFRQYNWGPEDARADCHFDQFRWQRQTMRYQRTVDDCFGVRQVVKFKPAIRVMPRYWAPGETWTDNGVSEVTFTEDGVVTCRGTMAWRADVLGYTEVAPGVQGIHIRSTQTTAWTEGSSDAGCAAGFVTPWEENYYLIPDMPIWGDDGTTSGFKRSVGGNLAGGPDRWDVWFDAWTPLPG